MSDLNDRRRSQIKREGFPFENGCVTLEDGRAFVPNRDSANRWIAEQRRSYDIMGLRFEILYQLKGDEFILVKYDDDEYADRRPQARALSHDDARCWLVGKNLPLPSVLESQVSWVVGIPDSSPVPPVASAPGSSLEPPVANTPRPLLELWGWILQELRKLWFSLLRDRPVRESQAEADGIRDQTTPRMADAEPIKEADGMTEKGSEEQASVASETKPADGPLVQLGRPGEPAAFVPSANEWIVLRALVGARQLMKQADLEAATAELGVGTRLSRRTIGPILKKLHGQKLVESPKGKGSGVQLTAAGNSFINANHPSH